MRNSNANPDIRIIEPEAFPEGLERLSDPPPRIFARGALPNRKAIGIVGTRRADLDARRFTRELASTLAGRGYAIISGGAEGIDTEAHRGALNGGGRTFVIQAAPLEDPYPARNGALFEEVLDAGGGWLGETPAGLAPLSFRFLARNRLIAALSDVLVVVQAPSRSGALSTARHARVLGVPTFAVPHAPWDVRGAGGVRLLTEDQALMCRSAADVLALLEPHAEQAAEQEALVFEEPASPTIEPVLSDPERKILGALERTPRHVDMLADATELSVLEARVALIGLAAHRLALPEAGGWRRSLS